MPQDEAFNSPRIAINRVYTRHGDQGQTSLVGGGRVGKDHPRIAAYGTVDELNAALGMIRATLRSELGAYPALRELATILLRVQHELFNLGAVLATPPALIHDKQPRIRESDVGRLEQEIDRANEVLPTLRSFVLPGGSRLSAELHLARTICRRAERECVALSRQDAADDLALAYLNRLSDALFVWSRWVDRILGTDETLWDPNYAASSSTADEGS